MNEAPRNVLVVGPSWIGDIVMAQSLFQTLCQRITNLHLSVLAPSWSLPLLSRMPEVATAIPTPFEHGRLSLNDRLHLANKLRVRNFEQAIILPRSLKAALVPFLARIPLRTGFLGEQRYGLLNDIRRLDKRKSPRTVQHFVQLGWPKNGEFLGSHPTPKLVTHPNATRKILSRLGISNTEKPVLAICPGAEFGPAKRWPATHYIKVVKEQLLRGWQVWLLGSAKDNQIAEDIYGSGAPHFYNLAGQTDLGEVVDLLDIADCVISNDSGLMHIAAAVDTPVIALYGSTSPKINPPLTSRATILWRNLSCSPCHKRDCPLGHMDCLYVLSVDWVLKALEDAFDSP